MECENGRANTVWWIVELTCHSMSDCEGCSGCPASEESFIKLRDTDEGVRGASCAGKDGPAIVVPVNDELSVAEKADNERDEKGGYRGRILCGQLERLDRRLERT